MSMFTRNWGYKVVMQTQDIDTEVCDRQEKQKTHLFVSQSREAQHFFYTTVKLNIL